MKQNNIRAVVLHGYNDIGRLRIIRWCRRHSVPCFLFGDSNIHGDFVRGVRRIIKAFYLRRIIHWCRGVMPCGTLGQAYFERYGADPEHIFFFPYEPDYELIRDLPAETIERTRRRFDLHPERRRLVFSARMISVKRADLLLDAFAAIAERRPQWDLVMAGEGPLRPALMERLPLALRSRVTWTGFIDDQSAISALYRLSDVLVLPSDYEPWALVINEAAAAELAIIASNVVGAAANLVKDSVNGRVFPSGDLAALTNCLLHVTNENRIDAMKTASADVLTQWREKADPVAGLRRALEKAGVLETPPGDQRP
jgi:glycosyltransferase involved in cell wall biosynthesis